MVRVIVCLGGGLLLDLSEIEPLTLFAFSTQNVTKYLPLLAGPSAPPGCTGFAVTDGVHELPLALAIWPATLAPPALLPYISTSY